MTRSYTARDITVLEGLEPVRARPGMYIGGVGAAGLHHLVWEIVDNAIDEAMNGFAANVEVTLHADGSSVTVVDDGRGVPVDPHPATGRSALEVIFTTLHAGGKFEHRTYRTAGGLHGVGASVVNALSAELVAASRRDGFVWEQTFRRGAPVAPLRQVRPARGSGTAIHFRPDPRIFPKTAFDAARIRARLEVASYLHGGVRFVFTDEARGETAAFRHEHGLPDYLARLVADRGAAPVHETPFVLVRDLADAGARLEIALHWTEATDEHLRSYVNGIPTASGGAHEAGVRAGIGKAVRNVIETHALAPKGAALTADDIREGLTGLVSLFLPDPQFQGQTKDRLNNPEAAPLLDGAVRPALEHWLNHTPSAAEAIAARIVLAARAREASRAAQQAVTRRSAAARRLTLPGKLSDCTGGAAGGTELFIVEGDSAGGSAKQGRDRTRQAILPLRGKVLNVESAPAEKVLANRELSDVVTALGCGVGAACDLAKLRYERVIILADADSDGNHIATLLLTFFYRFLPALITHGRVFLAQPPLYRIDVGRQTFWALDDAHRDAIVAASTNGRGAPDVTRFKGLGEMMPKVLWETTLNPATRRLLRVAVDDGELTSRAIADLMGRDPAARFRFIMARADEALALDV